ncbi:imelysin family protein, partial [Pseudorhodobacter sp.]|uniref:imelysin family protein n=1 Tax=Pseudorhodobacter sp. TaxID=1934400 RepID=UPI0026471DF4
QSIAYWPDTQGHRQRALSRILQGQDPILKNPENYGIEPVSARGLYALEAMLFDPAFNAYGPNDPGCTLIRAASRDLAAQAAVLRDAWKPGFAEVLKTAGSAENTRFLDATEARQALFTALLVSLQFDINERLGLPMGSFDKPRPLRAEGRLSNRAQRNLELSLQGQQALAFALIPAKGDAVAMREDFERVLWMVQKLYDPDFAGVDDPGKRFKLEALQTALVLLRTAVNEELSAALGVTMGLNALDGD